MTAAPDPPSRDPWRAPVGLEMEGRLGGQSFLDPSAPGLINSATMGTSRGGAGAAGEAAMGVRVLPWLSLGTHVAYGWSPPGEPRGDWQRAHADAFTIAAYARFYPGTLLRLGRFSPWLSAAFAPIAQLFVSTDYLVQGATVTATVTTTAFAVPLEVGLDYDITPAFYVGAVARLTPWFPLTRCLGGITALGAPQQGCSDTGLHAGDTSLFVGLGVGLRLFR